MSIRYLRRKAPNNPRADCQGYVFTHVLVAEEKLGRYLKPEEAVHHIDENKRNNDPNNIMIFATRGDHSAFHTGAQIYEENGVWYAVKKKDKIKTCPICGKCFKHIHNKYCSKHCARKGMSNTNKKIKKRLPNVEILVEQLIIHKGSFTAVGREFNMTGNAIVDALRKANLPYHSKDYIQK